MNQKRGISVVGILPPRAPYNARVELQDESSDLWHRRLMHASAGKLKVMNLRDKAAEIRSCEVCDTCEAKPSPLNLIR